MHDLVIAGGTLVTPQRTEQGSLAIRGEHISAVSFDPHESLEGKDVIDATGKIVIPGGVDPHCHYNSPFGGVVSETEEFSVASAFGGTTTIFDMHFHDTEEPLHDGVAHKKNLAAGKMAVDYALHVAVCGNPSFEIIDEIGDIIRGGIPGIKTLTTYGWIGDDGHRWGIIQEVAKHGGMSLVHAEDDDIARWQTKKYLREGKSAGAFISETRDSIVEEAAVRRTMLLCERAGSPLYVLHMYARAGVDAINEGRDKGLPFYGETLNLYITFTRDQLWKPDGQFANNYPTLKTKEDQDALWSALADGRLQTVGSDNCAMTREKRANLGNNVERLEAGAPTAELRLPLVYHLGVNTGRLTLEQFVNVVSTNAAKIHGIYPQKGHLAVGADADIVIIDPQRRWTVRAAELHHEPDYSPWEGFELKGKVVTTILRGTPLIRDERVVGSTTRGQFLPRRLLAPVVSGASDLSFEMEPTSVPAYSAESPRATA